MTELKTAELGDFPVLLVSWMYAYVEAYGFPEA